MFISEEDALKKSSKKSQTISNTSTASMMVWFEPWGERTELSPGQSIEVICCADEGADIILERAENGTVLWAEGTSPVFLLKQNDRIINSSCLIEAPATPPMNDFTQCHRELYEARSLLENVWETCHETKGDPNYWGVVLHNIEKFLKKPSEVPDGKRIAELRNVIHAYTEILKTLDNWCKVVGYPPPEQAKGLRIEEFLADLNDTLERIGNY